MTGLWTRVRVGSGNGDRDLADGGDNAALSASPMAAFLAAVRLATVLLPLISSPTLEAEAAVGAAALSSC